MIFSNATTYAVRAMLYLAIYSSAEKKIGIKELAEKLDVPYHFLGKIMQQLARKDLLRSLKGPNGGFYLNDSDMEQPMIRVVEIYEEHYKFFKCGLGLKECSEENPCPIHNDYKVFRTEFYGKLANQTIRKWTENVATGQSVIRL